MSLQHFPAPEPNGTGVLVLPGGGYSFVSLQNEGFPVAAWLNARGFDAWILTYTTVSDKTPAPIYPAPLLDSHDAVKKIRRLPNAPKKLGIWGWSAGGHLAAMTGTRDKGDFVQAQLDFMILAYPVIDMHDPAIMHKGSRDNLLGTEALDDVLLAASVQTRVNADTPPTFLYHTADDETVSVRNSLVLADALSVHGRPFEMVILPSGRHGGGLDLEDENCRRWTAELERWIKGLSRISTLSKSGLR